MSQTRLFRPEVLPPVLLAAAVVVSCLPLLGGFPKGHDWLYQLVRIAEYDHALADGQYPPYWAGNLYGGYGSPIFVYYAPGFLLAASLFSRALRSFPAGGAAAIFFFSSMAAITMYLFVREALDGGDLENQAAARMAAYAFVLNPYLIGDKLLRNAGAEFAALCVLPLALYGILRMRRDPGRGLVLLAVGCAATFLSHNQTALILAGMLVVGGPVLLWPFSGLGRLLSYLGGLALGLLMSAFHWIPALGLKSLVRVEDLVTGKFDFHVQFQPAHTFFSYVHFYSTGVIVPLILIGGGYLLWQSRVRWRQDRRVLFLSLGGSLFFVFLQLRASMPLWEKVGYLHFFQFPWRMMGPLALTSAVIGGLLFHHFFRGKSRRDLLSAEVLFFALLVINALPSLSACELLDGETRSQLSRALAPEGIRELRLSATARDEYLPRGARIDLLEKDGTAWSSSFPSNPPVKMAVEHISGTRITLDVVASQPSQVRIPRWDFPEWQVVINGRRMKGIPDRRGSFGIPVPAGKSRILLRLLMPELRQRLLKVSAASLLVLLLLSFRTYLKK